MRTDLALARPPASRLVWHLAATAAVALVGAFSIVGLALPPSAARAANVAVDQCNGIGPGPGGASTVVTCSITVVNTISSSGATSSTTTLTRQCLLDPCAGGNGTFVTNSTDLVTDFNQCNNSANVGGEEITCNVTITNNVSEGTPGAEPVTAATVNQCVGSGGGGGTGGTVDCQPFPATTTGATVTECNGSANGGGGGTVRCRVFESTVSPAIPIRVNQCNSTGNGGGSVVTCTTRITTNIIPAASPTPTSTASPTPTSTASPTPTSTASPTAAATATPTGSAAPTSTPTVTGVATSTQVSTGTSTGTAPQISRVPSGGVQTGGGSTAGVRHLGLLTIGGGLLLAAAMSTMLRRRVTRGG